ncbi:MAG: C-GCAxxG-C-C family (seleno)protein, partial [Halobacteriota archaeon]
MLTRRGFLKVAGGLTAAALGMGCSEQEASLTTPTPTAAPTQKQTPEATPDLPWPYVKLDVEKTRKLGHLGYHKGLHCAAGAFYAVVSQLKEEVGYPYTQIPMDMVAYGAGGVAGWATLCGAINGGACAINLVAGPEEQKALVNELVGYYTTAEFPTDKSNDLA